ncbi:MAG: hypothetical protein IIC79_05055 [Chloroflexi bacterium]|nr:hypothetical protein [Chloroflexota bacterium]
MSDVPMARLEVHGKSEANSGCFRPIRGMVQVDPFAGTRRQAVLAPSPATGYSRDPTHFRSRATGLTAVVAIGSVGQSSR